jgi:hypothetical protein
MFGIVLCNDVINKRLQFPPTQQFFITAGSFQIYTTCFNVTSRSSSGVSIYSNKNIYVEGNCDLLVIRCESLTTWSTVLEKLVLGQLPKSYSLLWNTKVHYRMHKPGTGLCLDPYESYPHLHPFSLRSILILSSYENIGLPSHIFFRFPDYNSVRVCVCVCMFVRVCICIYSLPWVLHVQPT